VLIDFAAHARENDVELRVLSPRDGPLIASLGGFGVDAEVVPGPALLLRGSQQPSRIASLAPALLALPRWASALSRHRFWTEARVVYTVAFKAHMAAVLRHDRAVVWHLHEFPPVATGALWKFLAGASPDALIANSGAVAAAWGRPEGGGGKITTVPNGVDLARFRPGPRTGWIHDRLGVPRAHRLIGMPAVFAKWKGQLEVLRAFAEIHREFPAVHLVFVGGSIYDTVAERTYGEELAASLQQAFPDPRAPASLLPFQPNVELAYPEFDLSLHYSLRPEPFGRVILESMACGVPVIAAAEGGPLEIMSAAGEGGATPEGWLAPPRDASALAATLRRALSCSSEALAVRGIAARTRAELRFSAPEFARGVAGALARVARERR